MSNFQIDPTVVSLFTDGACKGNPGPGGYGILMLLPKTRLNMLPLMSGSGAYGIPPLAWDGRAAPGADPLVLSMTSLLEANADIAPSLARAEWYGGETLTTNNRMEMKAALAGLFMIEMAIARQLVPADVRIELHSDSRYVLDGINDWRHGWKTKGWRTADKKAVKNQDLWLALDAKLSSFRYVNQASTGGRLSLKWVKGHDGHPGNERADQLANLGCDRALASI